MANIQEQLKPGCVSTLQDLATASGISYRRVREWAKTDGFPIEDDGSYSVWKVSEWITKRRQIQEGFVSEDGLSEREVSRRHKMADMQKAEADAQIRKLKLQEEAGRLVDRDSVKNEMRKIVHIIRTRFEAAPEEMASSFPADQRADCVADLKNKIQLILRELERMGKTVT